MAIKKKVKKKFAAKKTGSVSKPKVNESFFQRMKDVIKSEMPKQERVRVKTFIVEKPVIIHDKAQRYDPDDSVYDSRKSRYSRNSLATGLGLVKQKKKVEEEEFSEDGTPDEIDDTNSEEFSESDNTDDSDLSDEEPIEGEDVLDEEPIEEQTPTHTRSRGMFNNIWWKKALFWSILVWLFILAISMAMQAMKLIMVDLTRQWWVLLGIIILVEFVYFRFLDGKFSL